jgi:hypothetical protein
MTWVPRPFSELSRISLAFLQQAGLEQTWKPAPVEGPVSITDERRFEPRTDLHRIWNVSVESELLGHRLGQVLDYSASGMRLALDGFSVLKPGEWLEIHYPGTGYSYRATVAWSRQKHRKTIVGARLLSAASVREAC